jgi:hypothetical protein
MAEEHTHQHSTTTKKFESFPLALIAVSIIAIASFVFFFWFYQKTQDEMRNPNRAAETEIKQTISELSKLMDLPKETPTMATIMDKEQLKKQKFFEKAANGDKLVIFTKEQKAILYRPSTHKIITVDTINVEAQQAAVSSASAVTR